MPKSTRITQPAAVALGALALAAPAAQAVPYHAPAEWDATVSKAQTAQSGAAPDGDGVGWASAATGAVVLTLVAGAGFVARRRDLTPVR